MARDPRVHRPVSAGAAADYSRRLAMAAVGGPVNVRARVASIASMQSIDLGSARSWQVPVKIASILVASAGREAACTAIGACSRKVYMSCDSASSSSIARAVGAIRGSRAKFLLRCDQCVPLADRDTCPFIFRRHELGVISGTSRLAVDEAKGRGTRGEHTTYPPDVQTCCNCAFPPRARPANAHRQLEHSNRAPLRMVWPGMS